MDTNNPENTGPAVDYSVLEGLTTDGLTQLLSQLMQPDTAVVKNATTLLKQYFKTVKALENLLILMASSTDQNIRQLSCVYLSKIVPKLWSNLPAPDQQKTKALLLERFVAEPAALVKKNLADVIGSLAMLLIPNKEWNELFQFVFTYCQSNNIVEKEQAMLLLSVMIEYFSASDIATYYDQLNPIIESYLKSDQASLKRLAVVTVNNLTQTGHAIKVLKKYPELIPLVLNAIDIEQEDLITTIFETLTDFFETKKVLRPHLPLLGEAAINISLNLDLQANVRQTTLFFLEEIGETFGRALAKKNIEMIRKIVDCGFKVACEDTEEYADEDDSPHYMALCMLYSFAAEVPNEVAYPIFKERVLQCMQ